MLGGGRQDDSRMLASGENVFEKRHERTDWEDVGKPGPLGLGRGALQDGAGARGRRRCLKRLSTGSSKACSRPSGVCPGEGHAATGARGSSAPDSPGLHRGQRVTNPAGSTQEIQAQT